MECEGNLLSYDLRQSTALSQVIVDVTGRSHKYCLRRCTDIRCARPSSAGAQIAPSAGIGQRSFRSGERLGSLLGICLVFIPLPLRQVHHTPRS
jgi:hypothetical protein